jgi:hypothetical protein
MGAGDAEGGLILETPPPYLDPVGKKGAAMYLERLEAGL